MRSFVIPATAVAIAMLGTTAVVAREDSGKRIEVALDGASEAPGPGDSDGSGTATLRVNPGLGQVCFTLTVSNIAPATAAHIHEAPAGVAGPVVVPLTAPTSGTSQGCRSISRELAMDLITEPEDYYVNVHNTPHPAGAVRGQLG